MAVLAQQSIVYAGIVPSFAAAAGGGDKVPPNDHGYLEVINGGVGSINVTVVVPGNSKFGQANPDVVVAVANGARKKIGPFPGELAGSDGFVDISYSGVTSVTVGYFGV